MPSGESKYNPIPSGKAFVIRRIEWKQQAGGLGAGYFCIPPFYDSFSNALSDSVNFDIGIAVSINTFKAQVLGLDGNPQPNLLWVRMHGYFIPLTAALPGVNLLLLGKDKTGLPACRLLASKSIT